MMHRFAVWIISAAMLFAGHATAQNSCDTSTIDIRSDGSSVRFAIEVVDTARDRAVGLMNRPSMPRFSGMLFVYESEREVSFWMRNTMIPLDMIFIDSAGVIQNIHENAIPYDESSIFGGDAIQYVLEINGGMARALGISVGSEVRHAAISNSLVKWPCE